MGVPHGRSQFELAAQPGSRRIALVEHRDEPRRTDHDIGEIARLQIGQRIEFPFAATDQPKARILPLDAAVGSLEAQRAFIAICQPADLQFDFV